MPNRDSLDDSLRERARRALLRHTFFRWQSVSVAVTTALLSVIFGTGALVSSQPGWGLALFASLGVGAVAWAALLARGLTDEQGQARAVERAFREQHSPKHLRNVRLRVYVEKALKYHTMLNQMIQQGRDSVLVERLSRAIEPVDGWVEQIFLLAGHIDAMDQNPTIRKDKQQLPSQIRRLKGQLLDEDDPTVLAALERTIADRERQLDQLGELDNMKEEAEYQLQSTLAMLGTMYAQLQAIDLKGTERDQDIELRNEIDEQVHQLEDLSLAMDEVYSRESYLFEATESDA